MFCCFLSNDSEFFWGGLLIHRADGPPTQAARMFDFLGGEKIPIHLFAAKSVRDVRHEIVVLHPYNRCFFPFSQVNNKQL